MDYTCRNDQQLKNLYDGKVRSGKSNFKDFQEFRIWHDSQDKVCHYCKLKEEDSFKLVMSGLLKSKRFPRNGIIGQGKSRGIWLEVDRCDPTSPYSKDNCVLCCYFCNNDKSDVFTADQYKDFFQNRLAYLMGLTY